MSFLNELKRRHVFRVGAAYAVVGWLLIQGASILLPTFGAPHWVMPVFSALVIAGFPIALIVAWAFELTPEGLKRTEATDGTAPARASAATGRKLDFVIIGALVVALGYFVWDRYYGPAPQQAAVQSTSSTPAATAGTPTLAVLPFVDMSPNKDQGYFADGTAEELLNALAQLKGLRVTGRTSSFAFKGKNEDLRTIGETLGVENILEGSVRKEGDEVRVTAQLINAKTGYHLWSQTYDRKLTDIFAIQDEIAKAVAQALQVALGIGDFGEVGMTRNVAAYDEFLLSRSDTNHVDTDSWRKAIDHAERAVALDPTFSLAESLLYQEYSNFSLFVPPAEAANWTRKAEDALARARALTPNAPFVLATEIVDAGNRGQWLDADRFSRQLFTASAKHAVGTLGPDLAVSYGHFLLSTGRAKEAVAYLEQARAVNPLDSNVSVTLAEAYTASGNTADAFAELDRGRTLAGSQSAISGIAILAALGSGDRAEIDKRSALMKTADPNNWPLLANMLQFLDNRAAAPAEIRRLAATDAAGQSQFDETGLAVWAAYYGDPVLALDLLRKSATYQGRGSLWWGGWFPLFHDMRKLPGFKDLVRDLGLVDYWRQSGHWGDFCHPVGDNDFECD